MTRSVGSGSSTSSRGRSRSAATAVGPRDRRRGRPRSTSAVHHHLIALERDGLLERAASTRAPSADDAPQPVPRPRPRPERARGGQGHPVPDAGRARDAHRCRSWARSPPASRSRPTRTPPRRSTCRLHGGARGLVRPARPRQEHDRRADRRRRLRHRPATGHGTRRRHRRRLLEDNGVTLKRYFREKDRIRLQPANAEMEPIYATEVQIQGKVVGVIRRLAWRPPMAPISARS